MVEQAVFVLIHQPESQKGVKIVIVVEEVFVECAREVLELVAALNEALRARVLFESAREAALCFCDIFGIDWLVRVEKQALVCL